MREDLCALLSLGSRVPARPALPGHREGGPGWPLPPPPTFPTCTTVLHPDPLAVPCPRPAPSNLRFDHIHIQMVFCFWLLSLSVVFSGHPALVSAWRCSLWRGNVLVHGYAMCTVPSSVGGQTLGCWHISVSVSYTVMSICVNFTWAQNVLLSLGLLSCMVILFF